MKTLIVEDHSIIRYFLKDYLKDHFPDFIIEIMSDFNESVVHDIALVNPDLVLLDISLDKYDALDFFVELKNLLPKTHFIIYTMHNISSYKNFFWKAGASAYLLKEDATLDLKHTIQTVLNGNRVFPSSNELPIDNYRLNQLTFTDSEKLLLQSLLDEKNTDEIAEVLSCSTKEVFNLRRKILTKTGAKNTHQLINYAIDYNWLR